MWVDNIEDEALEQAKHLANLPFAFHHVAIMPDVHKGYGMPIGGILAAEDIVVVNAVGVDIACGVCAVKTSLRKIDTETLKQILGEIRRRIPVGFHRHKKRQDESLMPTVEKEHWPTGYPVVSREYYAALKQLGSLGGGNHFAEIQQGSDGYIWIMLHSGSRNIGKRVADYHNKIARELNARQNSPVPPSWDLAYLAADSKQGQAYLREMNYCVDFALASRKLMMERIKDILKEIIGLTDKDFDSLINIAHNYTALEEHFGKKVWVHRKGATLAASDTIGIVPGSQGSSSYIVKGKGNPESFNSCSHGAGRLMGRRQAIRTLDLEEEQRKLTGILHAVRGKRDLDEAAGAYKSIDEVMKLQQDLVEILVELKPLAVVKG